MRIPLVSWLSLALCCFWIFLCFNFSMVSGHCLEDQKSLLLQLKNSFSFQESGSTKLVLWNESLTCCDWVGVSCDEEGHVTGLDLSAESIYDGFNSSSSIFKFPYLQRLNLAQNAFINFAIPPEFSKLKNLTYLNLSEAGFAGQIPKEISLLTRLVTLHISSTSVRGPKLYIENPNLRMLVQNLTSIRQLYLDGVTISAQGTEWSNALLSMPSLQELSMSGCSLSGSIDSSLARLKHLSVIRLDQNQLSATVPETFGTFSNLTTLLLSLNELTGSFPKNIFQIMTLTSIDISFNAGLYGSFPDFPVNGSVQTLVVRKTKFSGELPDSISNLRNLTRLDLAESQFSGTLPHSMSQLTELTYLDLSLNKFTGPIPSFVKAKKLTYINLSDNALCGVISSPDHFEGLRNLDSIDLHNNSFNGSIPSSLLTLPILSRIQLSFNQFSQWDEFSNVSSSLLTDLDLSHNKIVGPIPVSIFQLRSLSSLDLSYNNLSFHENPIDASPFSLSTLNLVCCNLRTFPGFLRYQSELNVLDLSNNQIEGTIPNWIWELEQLRYLNLHSNQLRGPISGFPKNAVYMDYSNNNFSSTIPDDIGDYLSSTVFLSLSNNSFHGVIPKSFCNALNLEVLDLSHNNFSGTIPPCLITMSTAQRLGVLTLRENNLTGHIPDKFPSFCALSTLDLHGNKLHGPMPKSLANCTELQVLDIGGNQIMDVFPCFLNNISTLRVLVLRQNKFYGPIGCQNSRFIQVLQIIDLAFNNFNAKIPPSFFGTMKAMTTDGNYENQQNLDHLIQFQDQYGNVYYKDRVTWRIWYWQHVDDMLYRIFPQLDFVYECRGGKSFNISIVSSKCLEDQKSLLLQLKNSLSFNELNSTKLVSWNQNLNCCDWIGVSCDEEGHVTDLDLSGESIYGGFNSSSSIFSFQYLQKLNLASNSFNSIIPSAFYKLKNLTYLNLSYAGFVGQIPEEISLLTRLVTLDISSLSYLLGQELKLENPNLRMLVQNLTSIRQLYLDGVTISAQGKEWSKALLSMPSLQELSMSVCNLSGPIDSSLATLKHLSVISLNQNDFLATVPEWFGNFSNLTTLHLSSCGLTGSFPKNIFQIMALTSIDISNNAGLYGSFPDLPVNGSLQTLVVSFSNFSGMLPDSISNLRNLTRLDLSNSQFFGTLPHSMSQLTELTYLDLSFNNFTGPIPSFVAAKKLTHVDLSHNAFNGVISSPDHFQGLQNLVIIDLRDNSINGSIPSSLFTLPLLETIQLSSNKFSQLGEFSNVTSSKLNTLDLSSNNLAGPIPRSIFKLRSLSSLQLSSNKFNGSVLLDMIGDLRNLTTLDLSYNNLSIDVNISDAHLSSFPNMSNLKLACCKLKSFPDFLRYQSKLTSLDLSNNQIEGTIPNWIWKLENLGNLNLSSNALTDLERPSQNISSRLVLLDLHSNQLRGPISVFPQYAAYLDYSNNSFSSIIPDDIGDYLSVTIFLSLSNNSFHGVIPESFCNASNLEVLDLSHNNFSGTIPPCLMTMSETLGVLTLRKNNLTGQIPDNFSASCALKTLDLHGNHLHGPMPKSLANCTTLEVLDLGKNIIVDGFPCLLKNISTLRVLVLRQNQFHGSIGCPNTSYIWEKLQIADLAINNFTEVVYEDTVAQFDWHFVCTGVGFGAGAGLVVAPLVFWERGRKWSNKSIDKILLMILPMFGLTYTPIDDDDDDDEEEEAEEKSSVLTEDYDDNEYEDELGIPRFRGRYCVFCSKLDKQRKKVIHDPRKKGEKHWQLNQLASKRWRLEREIRPSICLGVPMVRGDEKNFESQGQIDKGRTQAHVLLRLSRFEGGSGFSSLEFRVTLWLEVGTGTDSF
ncbi:receptor-like protein 7 [Senna tora]|uniref:Receptor-like protein 7 n=1 Tax=Senna tora TaxID=362788 RepID=A0A834XHQ1_9FABA|nr:receptor-like protein 7 [Senna tora]